MKKTKMEKGITLIALIITIVVLLILAVVTINSIQSDGIIRYAQNAADDYTAMSNDEQTKLNTLFEQIGENLKDEEDEEGEKDEETESTVHNDIIPEGGIYYVGVTTTAVGDYTGATATYTAGDEFPTIAKGDVYVYGDYEYRYKVYNDWGPWTDGYWHQFVPTNGWSAIVLNKSKQTYGSILETINGENLSNLSGTFQYCVNMVESPTIPGTVTQLDGCFNGCSSLDTAPRLPDNASSLQSTFANCTNLVSAPIIPASVSDFDRTFYYCKSLEGVVEINSTTVSICFECFYGTEKTITLTGSFTNKAAFAATANNGNVTY